MSNERSGQEFEALASELEAQARVSMLNDPGTRHLPGPGEVGGDYSRRGAYRADPFEPGSRSGVGAGASIPMFEHAAAFPEAMQLRVWEIREGQPHGLGVIGIGATEEEFVSKFRGAMPGKFRLRPVDGDGHYLGQEFTKNISEHHALLREAVSGAAPAPMAAPGLGFLERMLELQREEMAQLRQQLEVERQTMARERMELAEERTALASNAATGVQVVAERMMSADQARQDQITNTLTGLFTQQIQLMQAQQEADRQRHAQRLEQLKAEQGFALERERERLARERERERDWQQARERERAATAKREAEDARARERLRRAEMDDSRAREREHAERMLQLSQRDGLSGAKKLLGEFGMKPADLLDFIRPQDSGDPSIGTTIVRGITEVGKSFAETAKANVEAQAKLSAHQANAQARLAQLELAARLEGDEYDEGPEGEPSPAPAAPGAPAAEPVYSTRDPRVAAAFSANPGAPAAAQQPQPAPRLQIPMATLRKARRGMAQLIQRCKGAQESQWEGMITEAIMRETAIIEYVSAATIRRAMLECGADELFAQRMIAAIDRSGLVPPSIPRG